MAHPRSNQCAKHVPGGRNVNVRPAVGIASGELVDTYRDYQRRVPMLLPWPKRRVAALAPQADGTGEMAGHAGIARERSAVS